ncbi:MAG: prepilin peptidase [Terracidiphilus sp.]|jgi:prepilin peptidase CpaA
MHSFAWWPTVFVLAVATFTDLRSRRIPNWLVLPFLLAGIVVSAWLQGWKGVGHSFAGLGLGLLIYGFLFWMGGMGAGDVKLCAAIGAWIGPSQLFFALVVAAMAGGIMALGWAVWGGFVKELFTGAGDLMFGCKQSGPQSDLVLSNPRKRRMPYAPAIAIGTLISFFSH